MALRRHVHPSRAVSYFQGNRRANMTPAIIWLFLALVGLVILRTRAIPTASQTITLAIMAGLVVAAGLVLPELITLFLVALLFAAVANVPGVGPFLQAVEGRVAQLTGGR